MKKTAVLLAVLMMTALLSAPVCADLIDPGLLNPEMSGPIDVPAEKNEAEEATEPANAEQPETPAEPAPAPAPNQNRVDSEAKSLSGPIIALAAGLLIIAVAALIRALVRNHKEAKADGGMKVS